MRRGLYTVGQERAAFPLGLLYLHRLTSPAVQPAVDAGWTGGVSSFFHRSVLSPGRGDTTDLVSVLNGAVQTALPAGGAPVCEYQAISAVLPPGLVFGVDVTVWAIIFAGLITGADVIPHMGMRIVDVAGGVTRATILAVGAHGSGAAYAGSNNYIRAAQRAAIVDTYTTRGDERLVAEMGGASVIGGGMSQSYGSRANANPSTSEVDNHVMGFQNIGNPGNRCPYIELDGVTVQ